MSDVSDEQLLRAWAERADQDAFRSLAARYGGLVHGAALRRVGDPGLAEEIAQDVFARLSQHAGRLVDHPTLAGWLHRATMLMALDRLRRRAQQERKIARLTAMNSLSDERDPLADALPLLDEAIDRLNSGDRQILMLHFAERLTYPQIAARLGSTADAVRMRSTRALGTLSGLLRKKKVLISAAMLATGLGSTLVQATPVGVALLPIAAAGAGKVSASTVVLHALQTMNAAKIATIATVVLLAAIPLILQQQEIAAAEARVAGMQRRSAASDLAVAVLSPGAGASASVLPNGRQAVARVDLRELGGFALDRSHGGYEGTRKIRQVTAQLDNNNLAGLLETVIHSYMLPAAKEALQAALLDEMQARDTGLYLEWTAKVLANPPPVISLSYSNYSVGLRRTAESTYRAWVVEHPAEARAWAANHGSDWAALKATSFAVLAASELMEVDPVQARPELEALPLDEARSVLLHAHAPFKEPEQAEDFALWASQLPDAEKRRAFVHRALFIAPWPQGTDRLENVGRVLDTLPLSADESFWQATRFALDFTPDVLKDAHEVPARQLEWVAKYVPEDRQVYAQGVLAHLYEPKAALMVLNTALDQAPDDQIIAGYVESEDMQWHQGVFALSGGYHGDTAFRLATRVQDPELRTRLLAQAWTDLQRNSPDAAREILSIPELSAADRTALEPAIVAARSKKKR